MPVQGTDSSEARLEFPAGFWEAAGGEAGDAAGVVWRVAAALHDLPLLQQALVSIQAIKHSIIQIFICISFTESPQGQFSELQCLLGRPRGFWIWSLQESPSWAFLIQLAGEQTYRRTDVDMDFVARNQAPFGLGCTRWLHSFRWSCFQWLLDLDSCI